MHLRAAWRELFRSVEKIDKVTKADIRRVASKTFVDSNRTVAVIETKSAGAAQPAGESDKSDKKEKQ